MAHVTHEVLNQPPLLEGHNALSLDVALREGGDTGTPIVLSSPESAAAVALRGIAGTLAARSRGLAGRRLDVTPVGN